MIQQVDDILTEEALATWVIVGDQFLDGAADGLPLMLTVLELISDLID